MLLISSGCIHDIPLYDAGKQSPVAWSSNHCVCVIFLDLIQMTLFSAFITILLFAAVLHILLVPFICYTFDTNLNSNGMSI